MTHPSGGVLLCENKFPAAHISSTIHDRAWHCVHTHTHTMCFSLPLLSQQCRSLHFTWTNKKCSLRRLAGGEPCSMLLSPLWGNNCLQPVNHWLQLAIIHQRYPLSSRTWPSPHLHNSDRSWKDHRTTFPFNVLISRVNRKHRANTPFLCIWADPGYERHFSDWQQTQADWRSVLGVDTCRAASKREE